MLDTLQALLDSGCDEDSMETLLNDIVARYTFQDDDDKRGCIALLFDYEQGDHHDPSDYNVFHGETVEGPRGNYLVLDDDEADAACREQIEQSVWSFSASFLSGATGLDESVFEALVGKCEGAQDSICSMINGSCGMDHFVEQAVRDIGRGQFLSGEDGNENEVSVDGAVYYVYRVG
jgi:hypothetical protein